MGVHWSHVLPTVLSSLAFGALWAYFMSSRGEKLNRWLFVRLTLYWVLGMTLADISEDIHISFWKGVLLPMALMALIFADLREFLAALVPVVLAMTDIFSGQIAQMGGNSQGSRQILYFVQLWPTRIVSWALIALVVFHLFRRLRREARTRLSGQIRNLSLLPRT